MSEKAAPAPLGSWAFWKPRVVRALIVGALAIAATQVLPTLPRDQEIEVRLARGNLSEVRITYLENHTALAGTTIRPGPSGTSAQHTARLPDGDYTIQIEAVGQAPAGESCTWHKETALQLKGERVVIQLD